MMMIKTVSGIDLKKFLKSCLLIIILLVFQTKYIFSNETHLPYQCLNDDGNFQLIIKKFEKDLTLFKEKNLYSIILSDLTYIRYCYEKEKQINKYFEIYEALIDDEIISKETYQNLKYDDNFFKKDQWERLFLNYILSKASYKRSSNNNKLDNYFPKSEKEFNNILKFIEILNVEKEKNFKSITNLVYYSYLENDYQYSNKVIKLFDTYLISAKELNDLESYIIFAEKKSEILKKTDVNYCKTFYDQDIKKNLSINEIKNLRNYYTDLKIIEINDQIAKIYENLFYCIPLSFEFSEKYSEILQFLLNRKNSKDLDKVIKDKHLQVVFWQLDNLKKIGDLEKFEIFLNIYENLQLKYDVSHNEKIKFEIFKINNTDEYLDLNKKEQKVTELLGLLDKLNFENYIERNPYLDKQSFKAEKLRLKLEIFRIYAEVLFNTGRKIQAVNILKEQIKYYESFRTENEYFTVISDEMLTDYKDTNQTLPDLYHQIIILFGDLKDKENYKKYSDLSSKLCSKLEAKENNYECYRVNLSILRGLTKFEKDLFSKNEIVELINRADKFMNNFLVSEEIKKYSKKNQARFKNDYINSIQFALIVLSPLDTREIIDFKYREKNHAYFYVCENDWQTEYLKNAALNKDIYKNAELGLLAVQSACLMNKNEKDFGETAEIEKKYFNYIFKFLDKHEEKNMKTKFKYLDTSGKTDKLIFSISGFYEYIKDFKTINYEKKFELKNRIFKNLQYEQAKILTKTNKNFLNKYISKDLEEKITQRNKVKIKYNNLVSKILFEENINELLKIKARYELEIDEIDKYIFENYKNFSEHNKVKTFSLNEVQKYLDKDEALIYLINEEIQQAFIISRNKTLLISDPYLTNYRTKGVLELSKKNITSEINPKFNENINALVYNTFFKRITDNLGDVKKLIILADKYYSSYPFEMMVINRPDLDLKKIDQLENLKNPKYFVEKYEISYLPNIEIFISLKNSKKINLEKKSTFLGIGNPKFANFKENKIINNEEIKFLRKGNINNTEIILNKYNELPFTEKELKEISKVFVKSQLLMREDANEADIKKMDLRKFDIISFATHAEVYGNFSEYNEPFLVLSPPENSTIENDGLLTTSEISELNLDSELVILSACNTSSQENKYAEGYSGLVSSFFSAGTKSVISTYWPVEDKAGYILMTKTMEKTIKNNISISEALRQTKIEFINGEYGIEYKKPFYWAPYIYLGL